MAEIIAGKLGLGDMWAIGFYDFEDISYYAKAKENVYNDYATQTAPLYFCSIKYLSTKSTYKVKHFIAFASDGEWSEVKANDVSGIYDCTNPQTQILDQTFTATDDSKYYVYAHNETASTFTPEIGFVRVNTNDITGDVADCPAIAYTEE